MTVHGEASPLPAVGLSRAPALGRTVEARWLALLLVVFLLSGASGLIYQVLWQRMLALVFGVSAYATATVLAAFMAGLALGGLVAGRAADRVQSPLLWYGLVEISIGIAGLLTPVALDGLQAVYSTLHAAVGGSVIAPAVRFVVAFVVLMVPTALMGASFPLIVTAALSRRADGGRAIGMLYAINTFGAVVGTVAAGFLLVGSLGIVGSIALAALLNLAAGAAAVLIARSFGERPREVAHVRSDAPSPGPGQRPAWEAKSADRVLRLLPWLLAISGFCSLAYEVVWTRLLILVLEATTYAFSVMLTAFLLGIAVGSSLVTPFLRRMPNGPLALATLQALVALTSLVSLQALARVDRVLPLFGLSTESAVPSIGAMAALAFVALFPPALFLGMSFPLAVSLYTTARRSGPDAETNIGRRLGSLYAVNVCGAIFGALAAGFLLVPTLGAQTTLVLLAGLSWLAGAVVLAADRQSALQTRRLVAVSSALLVGLAAFLSPSAYQTFFTARFPDAQVVWTEEGLETTVTVTEDEHEELSMYLNHHHQANTADWMVFFHRMLGHVPMLVHPDPREVLVVGLGGGATAGATTRYEGAQVTVVELSRSVIRGAEWFRDVNYAVLDQPNIRLIVDDGRNHLLLSGHQYDVITADAIWPTHAGATNLYSVEYYRLARRALRDGGIMLQWVNRALPEEQHKLMMRTFLRVFPHVSLWFDGSLLVGSNQPIDVSLPSLERKLAWPITRASLQQVNLRNRDDVTRLYIADRAAIEAYVGAGDVITDDRPHLEYFLGLSANSGPERPR